MSKHRVTLIASAVFAAGALVAAIPLFALATAQPMHDQSGAVPSASGSDPLPQWREPVTRARQVVRTAISEHNLPGVSVAVGAGGELVWAEGFGWADLERRAPVTPETRFRIGEASTLFTAAGVRALEQRGRLKLDDEIQIYVPGFPRKDSPVTVRQLMRPGGIRDDWRLARVRCERPVDAVSRLGGDDATYGWVLVSAAIEAAADQPFLAFMREQVFEPRGMRNTGAESSKEENREGIGEDGEDAPPITAVRDLILKPLGIVRPASGPVPIATTYLRGFGPAPLLHYGVHLARLGNLSCYAGALAFFSTPSDLVRFGEPTPEIPPGTRHPGVANVTVIRDGGVVVAVTSNIADADTATLARRVARSF